MSEAMAVDELLHLALAAHDDLTARAETVEDEWTYVTDLAASWRERLEDLLGPRGGEPVEPAVRAAVDRVIVEAGLVRDPHRAIDWLSTFPQVVLTAVGERP